MARMTLHEGDVVAFLDRQDKPVKGKLELVPWGRRTWGAIRRGGRIHVVPRSRIIGVCGKLQAALLLAAVAA